MRALLAALVAVATLTSCGVPEVEPTQLLDTDTGPKRGIRDTLVVERALEQLVDDDSGRFSSTLLIGGGDTDFVDSTGAWRFSSYEGSMRTSTTPREGPRTVVDYRIFERTFFFRETKGRDAGCWTALGTPNTPPWTPAGNVVLPSQVQALLTAKGARTRSPVDEAQGTVQLTAAVGVFGVAWTQALKQSGTEADDVRLRVTFALKNGRFVGWSVLGRDLLAAVRKAGLEPGRTLASQLSTYSVDVKLMGLGKDVDIEVPSGLC